MQNIIDVLAELTHERNGKFYTTLPADVDVSKEITQLLSAIDDYVRDQIWHATIGQE